MGRIIDLLVGVSAVISISSYVTGKYIQRRRSRNIEHVKQLLEENREIDDMIGQINDPSKDHTNRSR